MKGDKDHSKLTVYFIQTDYYNGDIKNFKSCRKHNVMYTYNDIL